MGKLKNYAQDWLEHTGYSLGYSISFLPDLSDFDTVKLNRIDAQDYDTNQTLKKGKSKNDNRS
jgi:hypothetical protein